MMKAKHASHERVSIATAMLRLAKSYGQVQRLIAVRELGGGQDESRKWWVDAASLAAFEERTRTASNAAA